jgi:hypothetical protein
VHAIAGQADQNISSADAVRAPRLILVHKADRKAGKVVFTRIVGIAHFGNFTANQGAAYTFACVGHAADDRFDNRGLNLVTGQIVEEEQWTGALAEHIIDHRGYQVDAGPLVRAKPRMQADFRANAIRTADKDRVADALQVRGKCRAEAADASQYLTCATALRGQMGLLYSVAEALNGTVLRLNAYAALFIGQSRFGHL